MGVNERGISPQIPPDIAHRVLQLAEYGYPDPIVLVVPESCLSRPSLGMYGEDELIKFLMIAIDSKRLQNSSSISLHVSFPTEDRIDILTQLAWQGRLDGKLGRTLSKIKIHYVPVTAPCDGTIAQVKDVEHGKIVKIQPSGQDVKPITCEGLQASAVREDWAVRKGSLIGLRRESFSEEGIRKTVKWINMLRQEQAAEECP
jgi:hypothetical protein